MNAPKSLLLAALAVLLVPAVHARGDDDLYEEVEREERYDDSEKMTKAQKEAQKAAEKLAKAQAKAAEKLAKAQAKAAEKAAKGQPRRVRDSIRALLELQKEQAELGADEAALASLEQAAAVAAVDLGEIPTVEEILETMHSRAEELALFYESLVAKTPDQRATALAEYAVQRGLISAAHAAFLGTLNELQVEVYEARFEVAKQRVEVGEEAAEAQEKSALAALDDVAYAQAVALQKAAEAQEKAALAALPADARVWRKKALEAAEDAEAIDDVIEGT